MYRCAMQALDLMTLDIDFYKYDARHLAVSSIIVVLGLTFKTFTIEELRKAIFGANVSHVRHPMSQKGKQIPIKASTPRANYIYEHVLSNLDIEFSHMVISYCETFCDIRVPDLKDAL